MMQWLAKNYPKTLQPEVITATQAVDDSITCRQLNGATTQESSLITT